MSDTRDKVSKRGVDRRSLVQLAGVAAGLAGTAALARAVAAQTKPSGSSDMPSSGELDTSDILVETLLTWGVTHIFGIVGDGINGIVEALRKRQNRIAFVGVRHEESAAFMASAFAKYTGRLGQAPPT
jgi:pyruvate dehydrogenase (quinone)